MILTQCAVCATELGLSLGKKCGRCSTRYCGPECQVQHWKEGGHDQLCKKIKKAGGAEQYNADKKCAEAVAVAVEACADDHEETFGTAFNLAIALHNNLKFAEAQKLLRERIPDCERSLGRNHELSLRFPWLYANCLCDNVDASLADLVEAVEVLESVVKSWKRVMGERHPEMANVLNASQRAREQLRNRRAASD